MLYRNRVMAVYIIGVFMTVIDGTMVNVALPTLAREFDVESTDIEWIAVAYLLALAAVIPVAGWLGDRFGTKRMFLISLSGFVGASLLCGLAQTLEQLVAFRVLQGAAGGLIIPIGSAMLFRAFPLEDRARAAVGVLSVAVLAPVTGPVLGGIIVDNISWRWIFFINGPIGAVGIGLALLWLREERHDRPGRFDVAGFVLSASAVSALIYALSIGPEQGWIAPATVACATYGVVALVTLVIVELRVSDPMLKLSLLRDRLFRSVNISSSMVYAGFFGLIFVLPLYLQTLRGFSATESGLAQSPQAFGVFLVSNLVGQRLYKAVGPRRLMVVGAAATGLITMTYGLFDLATPLGAVAALSFARGCAVGMVFVSIQTAVYATTSLEDTGRATSLFNTQRQVSYATGVALGATVIAARLATVGGDSAPAAERLSAYQWGFFAVGAIMLPAAITSWFIDDDAVAATRGLDGPAPSPEELGTQRPPPGDEPSRDGSVSPRSSASPVALDRSEQRRGLVGADAEAIALRQYEVDGVEAPDVVHPPAGNTPDPPSVPPLVADRFGRSDVAERDLATGPAPSERGGDLGVVDDDREPAEDQAGSENDERDDDGDPRRSPAARDEGDQDHRDDTGDPDRQGGLGVPVHRRHGTPSTSDLERLPPNHHGSRPQRV